MSLAIHCPNAALSVVLSSKVPSETDISQESFVETPVVSKLPVSSNVYVLPCGKRAVHCSMVERSDYDATAVEMIGIAIVAAAIVKMRIGSPIRKALYWIVLHLMARSVPFYSRNFYINYH